MAAHSEEDRERIAADLALFAGGDATTIRRAVEIVGAFLADPMNEENDVVARTATLAREVGAKPRPMKNAVRSLVVVLQGAARHGESPGLLRENLLALGLSDELADAATEAWSGIADRASTRAALGTLAVNKLVDMKWSFGLTVGTDEVRRLGETYLQLKLSMDVGNGRIKDVHMELTLPQFYELLAELERAQSFVQFLTSSGDAAAVEE